MQTTWLISTLAICAAACGSSTAGAPAPADPTGPTEPIVHQKPAVDPYTKYAELEIGADYATWTKVNSESFPSRTHGGRFVDVYVNDVGLDAYLDDSAEIPVGTVVVKTSIEVEGGEPTGVAGPLFVMAKKEPGYAPDQGDWWYALHWAEVPDGARGMNGVKQAYWRSPSSRVEYCSDCHDALDRALGGVPADHLAPR